MNKIKKQEKVRKKSSFRSPVNFEKLLNALDLIQQEFIRKVMPFLFFIFLLCLLYIGNIYQAEKSIRNIDKTGKELKELRSAYISGKSEIMFSSNQSQIARSIETTGIKESVLPPKKIVVKQR